MRITRLSFAGFGPYRDEQSIDFRAFEDDGIYLIGGRTGAGKSTILDAICFALYASVPRFEKGEARLRSDHSAPSDPTWVELEFSAGGREYRVRRSPTFERAKARGEGTTTAAPTAELAVFEDGQWLGLAARPKDVGIELEGIVQLTRDQFLQVILLAQNRFQRFLAAGHDERQDLLRSLFATERFSSFEGYLVERRKAVEGELGSELAAVERLADRARALVSTLAESGLTHDAGSESYAESESTSGSESRSDDGIPAAVTPGDADSDAVPDADTTADADTDDVWFSAVAHAAGPARREADRRAAEADDALAEADAADRRAQELAARVRRRDAAIAERDRLAERAEADAEDRLELAAARAAAPLWPLVETMDAAGSREARARTAFERARTVFSEVSIGADPDPAGTVDALTRELGSLADALVEERSIPGLDAEADRARDRLASARRAADEAAERRDALPAELESARSAVAAARAIAHGLDAATAAVEGLKLQVTAAHDVLSREKELRSAREREIATLATAADATARLQHLLTRRLAGFAGELAEDLTDGEPCAVCGSTSHPAPAPASADAVRDEDLDTARSALEDANTAVSRATRAVREADAAHTQALVASGGVPVEELDARLAAAETHRDECASASARLPALDAAVAGLIDQTANADTALADRIADRDAAAEAATAATIRLDAARSRVSTARGDHSSVADRVARVTGVRDAAAALVDARAALEERTRELEAARAAVAAALAEHSGGDGSSPPFPDADAVRDARRSDSAIRSLEVRVQTAAEERAANVAALSDPDIAELGAAVPDTAATADALRTARAARDAAIARATVIAGIERELEQIRIDALSALSAVRARRDEVEAIRGLADTVEGKAPNTRRMDLETFVLAAQLEQIIAAANRRFAVMTSGRFALEHDDAIAYRNTASGLGLSIRDEYTGRSRPTASLSGGETFLAALALALGLAEVVTERAGGITLETLFIDEGFGSLDGETLEIAMSTLDELRAGGRTVGLISHVDAMKERIAARLTVEVDETGASHVRQRVVVPSDAATAIP
ncbi:exonuclease SbcC [Labedella gwakjiensis]|uniref:Nuclease SbcCD subunit C n=1 Tax=Labedella gwakjiensis TaxID=390269 RepID=A0A2P8GSE4_9MICO|nr:SMC family ATPase [Labedella gwakjiensis]PSL36877.1 exonuclease SbcC [Labedella gwakjiensis]RUQ84374.1 SMC family ATPase [Labedella gwakjiensis]